MCIVVGVGTEGGGVASWTGLLLAALGFERHAKISAKPKGSSASNFGFGLCSRKSRCLSRYKVKNTIFNPIIHHHTTVA